MICLLMKFLTFKVKRCTSCTHTFVQEYCGLPHGQVTCERTVTVPGLRINMPRGTLEWSELMFLYQEYLLL